MIFKEVAQTDRRNSINNSKDKIDILIDLKWTYKRCRTGSFCIKPAKIQINFLGFPGTMGADYMDYIIADK